MPLAYNIFYYEPYLLDMFSMDYYCVLLQQQLRTASMMTEVFPKVMMSQSDLQSLLLDNCTKKYYIEYNGFMSNHMSHGIIALFRLGATVEQIQRFVSSAYKAVISRSVTLFTCNKIMIVHIYR